MGKREKLIEKIEKIPWRTDVTFSELEKYLKSFSFEIVATKGSHVHFKAKNGKKITIPNNINPVKPAYVRLAVEAAHDED